MRISCIAHSLHHTGNTYPFILFYPQDDLKVALSIAGSDSGAGAGIQADLKTFSALGVYGCTALTAITAQNTKRVSEIYELPRKVIKAQVMSVLHDFSPDVIKVGMVYSKQVIETVCTILRETKIPIILDPILAAGTGAALLRQDAFDEFVSELVPLCELVTPNKMEAEKLSGMKIKSEKQAIAAAEKIRSSGARNVIIKGGHFGNRQVTDLLIDSRSRVTKIARIRVNIEESHGSGCNFSAAAAAFLANGSSLEDACRRANDYVHTAIRTAVRVGKGLPVTNPLSSIYSDAMKYRVVEELRRSVEALGSLDGFHKLIPETQTNFVYALPDAKDTVQVAGVRGRIVKIGNAAVPASCIEFGASRHVASAVLAFMAGRPDFRAAINIRYERQLARICKNLFDTSSYDRQLEPPGVKRKEGSTMAWGIRTATLKNPKAEVIYHKGDLGKEPMINVFGRTPAEVLDKVARILENYQ